MRLTAQEVETAIAAVVGNQSPGELLDFQAVAEHLNARLEANLIGRPPEFAGKYQRELRQ